MALGLELTRALLRQGREHISPEIVDKTRLHIADSIAIALAARASLPIASETIAGVAQGEAAGACRVIGSDRKLPPTLAAFANGALIHAIDFDDIHDLARLHPSAVTVAAGLAAWDVAGGNWNDVVRAILVGNETMCRLGLMWKPGGAGPGADWFLTQLLGYFGAAATSSLVLGLSESGLLSALGLAYMQAAGGKEPGFGVGATSRSIYPAFAAMGGVQASLLARAGIVGPSSFLDGRANLFRLYFGQDASAEQVDELLHDTAWAFEATDVKPWPSCRLSHPYVAAALEARQRIGESHIESVRVSVNESAARLSAPLPERRRPHTLQDAKYSVPFMTAFALARGRVDLTTLGPDAIEDETVLALAERIEIVQDLPDNPGHPPARIVVRTSAGSVVADAAKIDLCMRPDAVRAKFVSCLDFAGVSIDSQELWAALAGADGPAAFPAVFSDKATRQQPPELKTHLNAPAE
jgi:2-methylcitrate dehydratase PrpD